MASLKDIVSITGKSGLYQIRSRTNNGLIVESLDEKRSKMKINTNFQISVLEEITIYTQDGSDLHLRDVFRSIREQDGEQTRISHKAKPPELKEYFQEVAPTHDPERVYPSDIKKVIQWYNILSHENLLSVIDEDQEAEGNKDQASGEDQPAENNDQESSDDNASDQENA
jgi:hypothetical protein